MRRAIGRKPLFFLVAALVSAALVPACPAEFRWVAWFSAGLALFWTVLLAVEDLVGPGPERISTRTSVQEGSPFDPPPVGHPRRP